MAEVLTGGAAGQPRVVRIGDTVRRRTGPWTPAVHALLRHLESVGFDGAPRVLGIDEEGREVLTYIEGVEGRVARRYDDETLAVIARRIREFHDAVASFGPPADARWRTPTRPGPDQIVCHHDLAPYNTIFDDDRITFIDWDLAGLAPPEWDLAHAAWKFVPLYPDDACEALGYATRPRAERYRIFCAEYGGVDPAHLIDVLRARLTAEPSDFAQRCLSWLESQSSFERRR